MHYYNTGVTVELREIIESGIKIWDFDYPSFYTGADKTAFEQKVIDHYYFRQIGQETVARFKHYFRSRIREIMPYYIQLYESEKMMHSVEDPFKSYDLTETFTSERSGTHSSESSASSSDSSESESSGTNKSTGSDDRTGSNNQQRIFSDTPQGDIDNLTDHMSEATKESGSNTEKHTLSNSGESSNSSNYSGSASSEASDSGESSESFTHTLHRYGNIGVQPLGQEINAYRSALLNIDMQIIENLNDLFLLVY